MHARAHTHSLTPSLTGVFAYFAPEIGSLFFPKTGVSVVEAVQLMVAVFLVVVVAVCVTC